MVNFSTCLFFVLALFSFTGVSGQVISYNQPYPLDVANTGAEESLPILSPDGKSLYFVRTLYDKNMGGKFSGQDIWKCERSANGQDWEPAVNTIDQLNNKNNNAVVGINDDGNTLYLLNTYQTNEVKPGISVSFCRDGSCSTPLDEYVPVLEDQEGKFYGTYVHPSEKYLLISMEGPGSLGKEDLYVSIKDSLGNWSRPIHMGSSVNTPSYEISPFLSADGRKLYFASAGHGGYGDADIFVSERLYDSWSVWSTPKNLGPKINSEGFDAYFFMSEDGDVFFSSNRDQQLNDIYVSKRTVTDTTRLFLEDNATARQMDREEVKKFLGVPIDPLVLFGEGGYSIAPEYEEILYYITQKLLNQDDVQIQLVGITNEGNSREANLSLSKLRAVAVKDFMIEQGLSEERIEVISRIDNSYYYQEMGDNDRNRRVEIVFNRTS
jgi:outer membrane protein OmpA-like peptidoglycan-associated protein